ncbi:MAG: DUF423 domain-containing protein [Saprospiraceae bacterium]|jgi:uncharacterized membrane protein YgdD (TMEM256/DUF423 family)|nr:DUF423 domain-containing protein [Lewinellaceae bacterium]
MNHSRLHTIFFQWTAALGASAVIIGAFGAHGLKPHLSPYQLEIFEKGVQYQFVHALALFGTALLMSRNTPNKLLRWSANYFVVGIFLFSGSLYLLACRDLIPISVAWVGPVTPLGGLCFLGGWITLLLAAKQLQVEST